jgi:membrane-bound serine protease (ClpP class)
MWCHLLLLVPVAIAGVFWFLPWTTALPMAVVLTAGTAMVVAVAWRAMRRPVATGREAMVGRAGEAVSDVSPEGLVRLRGELWLAEARQPVSKGSGC